MPAGILTAPRVPIARRFAAAALAVLPGWAGIPGFPDLPGAWQVRVGGSDARTFGLSETQARLFLAKIEAVARTLGKARVFNPPLGFKANGDIDMCCSFECGLLKNCAKMPVLGRFWLRFNYFVEGREHRPVTDVELRTEVEFHFNDPYTLWDGDALLRFPDRRKMAWQPVEWGKAAGVTLYHNQRRGILFAFITRKGRPLWIPVTRQQYLTELIRSREADLARNLAGVAEPAKAMFAKARAALIEPLRTQLEAMAPADQAAQAWVAQPGTVSPLVPANAPGARAVVAFNPDYFDSAQPRTEFQLITVCLTGIPSDGVAPPPTDGEAVGRARLLEFVNEVDWQGLADLIGT